MYAAIDIVEAKLKTRLNKFKELHTPKITVGSLRGSESLTLPEFPENNSRFPVIKVQ